MNDSIHPNGTDQCGIIIKEKRKLVLLRKLLLILIEPRGQSVCKYKHRILGVNFQHAAHMSGSFNGLSLQHIRISIHLSFEKSKTMR